MTEKRIIIIATTAVVLLGLFFAVRYGVYLSRIKHAEFRYSIAQVKERHYNRKVIGKVIEYNFKDNVYQNVCATHLCNEAEIGDRYFVKIYLKDPTVFEIIDLRPDSSLVAPREGWERIP